jgi:hypothetical protein
MLTALLTACGLLAGMAQPRQGLAQGRGMFERASADRHVIVAQLTLGITFAEQADQALQASGDPEGLERVKALALESYKLLRFALAGLKLKMSTSRTAKFFTDPMAKVASSFVDRAMHHNRVARMNISETLAYPGDRAQKLPAVNADIQETIRLARQAIELL